MKPLPYDPVSTLMLASNRKLIGKWKLFIKKGLRGKGA